MNPTLTTTFAHADPTVAPITINELIDLLNILVATNLNGSYIPYILQTGTPGVDDQDKAWIELDSANRPRAIRTFYQGNWRRVYNGMIGEVRGFTGAPGYGDPPALFNSTGLGNIGLEYDGWAICNGENGTPNLTDKFIIGAHMDNSNGQQGYDSGWQTFVNGVDALKTGGEAKTMILPVHLPELASALEISGNEPNIGGPDHATAHVLVDRAYGATAHVARDAIDPIHYGADPNGTPPQPQEEFPVLPPFYALAFITFKGYA